jgi:hypothetical protein
MRSLPMIRRTSIGPTPAEWLSGRSCLTRTGNGMTGDRGRGDDAGGRGESLQHCEEAPLPAREHPAAGVDLTEALIWPISARPDQSGSGAKGPEPMTVPPRIYR